LSARRSFPFVVLTLLLFAACTNLPSTEQPSLPPDHSTTNPVSSDWYAVYFTQPGADFLEGGPDEALAQAIDDARLSVDVAVYDLNLATIRNALLHAAQRGVTVRMVMESDNMDDAACKLSRMLAFPSSVTAARATCTTNSR
jgi:hypothetical protein